MAPKSGSDHPHEPTQPDPTNQLPDTGIDQAPIEGSFDPNEALYTSVINARTAIERIHDPERRARMEQVQAAMEEVADNMHELHNMSPEEQDDVLTNLAGKLFEADPEAQEARAKIEQARNDGQAYKVEELVKDQSQRYNSLRRELAFELGIEIEDVDAQNEEYRTALVARLEELGDASPEEVLHSLGFLIYDEKKGAYRFNFPQDLFPPHILDRWENYERNVREHTRLSLKYDLTISDDSEEIVRLDMLRRFEHNHLARAIQEFLKLEDWDLKKCREFVTKMVEHRFPTLETKEAELTGKNIGRLRVIHGLGKIMAEHNEKHPEPRNSSANG